MPTLDLAEILDKYDTLPADQRKEIDKLLEADAKDVVWRPLINIDYPDRPTPQQQAFDSKADILLYGGSAGGGKSSLLIGLALTVHKYTSIFRREINQLHPIAEEIIRIRGTRNGYNGQINRFMLGEGRAIWLNGMQHEVDRKKAQGHARDLMCFDELTQFLESQFRYVITWNRSNNPNQRFRIVCASNPPETAEGDWVIKFWAPWLDSEHPNPALPGELRWFISDDDGNDKEVDGPEDVMDKDGKPVTPRSRTFIPSSVDDNPFLLNSGYKASLQALPEPLRSQMLTGDFMAGREDNPWQVVPTAWVELAQERWEKSGGRKPEGVKMTALGMDPARGGKDNNVLSPRYGHWFGKQITQPGTATPDGAVGAALCMQYARNSCVINIDIIGGAGASVYDHLKANGVNVQAIDGRRDSTGHTIEGGLAFFNERSCNWWRMREALDPEGDELIELPPDRELKADLTAPMWKMTSRGIQVEGKATENKDGFGDIKKRLGRSPDKGDSAVNALKDGKVFMRGGRKKPARANSKYNPHRVRRR